MIERLGHDVIEAQNGEEAVAAAISEHPDIALMDLSMPETDGLAATRAMRELSHCSRCRNLTIIAITAYPETLSKTMALEAGCQGYIRKPIDFNDLLGVLNKIVPQQ
jgi:two-component system cell cycle response regulator DivK